MVCTTSSRRSLRNSIRKWRDAQFAASRHVLGPGLGERVEDGVAATGVGFEGMLRADAVAELDLVLVAGTAAIGVIRAVGKERAEDAVLHVKHGHVLVNGDFKPVGRGSWSKRFELHEIQIVGGRNPLQAEPLLEIVRP